MPDGRRIAAHHIAQLYRNNPYQIWRVRENYLGKGNNKQTKRPFHVGRIKAITAPRNDRHTFALDVQMFYRPHDTALPKAEADTVWFPSGPVELRCACAPRWQCSPLLKDLNDQ
jgi:hypothetical protein